MGYIQKGVFEGKVAIKTAIVLAGGLGTRLRPFTLRRPKALIPIRGISLTEHVIEKLKEAGVKTVYLSVGYLAEKIIDYFDHKDVNVYIKYLIEKKPLGTGGCLHLISEEQRKMDFFHDFIVVNGDNLFDLDWDKMHQLHKKKNALITIALTKMDDVTAYGVPKLNGNKILKFVEKPPKEDAPSNYISGGYYIFSRKVLDILPSQEKFMLEHHLFPKIANMKRLYGYKDDGQWFDTGTFEKWENAINNWRVK